MWSGQPLDAVLFQLGRVEDMEQDLQFIQEMAGFQFGSGNLKDKVKKMKVLVRKKNALTKMLIDQLDKKQLGQVYELFKVDFEMFGYDPVL
jgi:predicted RNA-binding protein